MKTTINSLLLRVSALASLALVLVSAPSANAVTFTVANSTPLSTSTVYQTNLNPTIATFNFTGLPGFTVGTNALPDLRGLALNINFLNLDTGTVAPGSSSQDFNNLSLVLNGFNTGLKLNEFSNFYTQQTLILNNVISNTSGILSSFNSSGVLVASIFDATSSPINPFWYGDTTAYLTVSDQPVPFTPTQSLGLGLMALLLGVRKFPSLRRFMFARA